MDRNSVDWRGYIPAVTTTFTKDGALDLPGYSNLLEWLNSEGMHGIVVGGTTGEWFSLSPAEWKKVMRRSAEVLKGRLTIIAGCNAFTAAAAVEKAQLAAEYGFDGVLVTPPPYIVPRDEEIVSFYTDLSNNVSIPICVYNWPPGTNIDMSLDVLRRVAELENVVAIKNSTSRLDHFVKVFFELKDQVRIFGFGMDALGQLMISQCGGDGTMGAGGVLGRDQPDFYNHLWAGDLERSLQCGARDRVLMEEWFTPSLTGRFGSAQAIMKAALNCRGLPGGWPRRPILPLGKADSENIRETLRKLGKV